ncbi:voltage-gated potassium channel [Aureococcus anophagefferens]|nr:voltage-gated potassium channel [Aureococcus anophagefferens]
MRVEPRGVARVLASAAVSAAVVALLSAPAAGPGALRLGSSAGTSVATLTYGDFLELDGIKKFLGDEGLANASSYDELSDLVPREIVTRATRNRAEGVVGVAASLGYVAFGLSRSSPHGGTTAAYVLVMDYRGAVVALSPTLGKVLRQKGWSDADERELYKPLAIKPYNSSALLADGYTVIKKYDAATGRELAEFAEHRVEDPNHVQLIEEDSLRVRVFSKGSAKSSRLLCLRLNEAEGVATVTFIYSLGSKTPHFGDNDRLPTGNFLGLHWPDTVDYDDQFEVRVIEVENDGDVAMEIKVAGDLCRNATGCYRDDYGWTSYSAERFYDAPLVYETTCGLHAVSFKTVSNFKQNDLANGTYAVRVNGDERKSGAFSFKPHWRPQDVTVDGLGTLAANDVVILRVANAWGDETSTTLDCAPGA